MSRSIPFNQPDSRFRAAGVRLVVLLAALAVAIPVRGDDVYLKDGTILHGRVIQTRTTIQDASGLYEGPAGDGVFAVYDGCRIVVFSRLQLDPDRLPEKTDTRANLIKFERKNPAASNRQVPPGKIEVVKDFNAIGRRTIKITNDRGFYPSDQLLTYLTPYQLRISSLDYSWAQNFLISELDRKVVKSLLMTFPLIKDEKDPFEKQMRIYRFVTEANWFDESEKMLKAIEKEFNGPKQKERLEKARQELTELEAESTLEDATVARNAGQVRYAQMLLNRIPKQGISANLRVNATTLRVKIENSQKQFEKALHYLRLLPDAAEGPSAEVLVDAAGHLRDELNYDALDRLQPFIDLAEQADNAQKQGQVPAHKPEQLLAYAVTGWLLGPASAEGKPDTARKLWRARQFAREYLRTHTTRARNALLEIYEKWEPVELDELAHVIALLPPAEPDNDFTTKEAMDRKTNLPNSPRGPVDYRIQLPLEYTHGRPYPLLIALPNDNENLTKGLERYRYDAARNGYIVVAPEWSGGFGGGYNYSSEEHARVLDVIRDVRRHYNVDSDRIFISGFGEGGNAAWDIGLSHPDLFAAIVPIASQPRLNVMLALWPNAMYTPVYAVTGEMMGYATRNINRVTNDWINKGFPCLHVVYRGRGYEWFPAELANAFEWMNRRKRLNPNPELGHYPYDDRQGTSLCTIRESDDRFFWLSTESIKEVHLLGHKSSPTASITPARMQAIIKPGNQVVVSTWGLNQVTVWFGLGMLDFSRPVSIKLNGYADNPWVWTRKQVRPSLSLMMEDLYERGDKTRLFVAKVPLKPNGQNK